MSSKSEMTTKYSELAPQFLYFLSLEMDKINAQVERLKSAEKKPEIQVESDELLEEIAEFEPETDASDSPVGDDVQPVLIDEDATGEDPDFELDEEDLVALDSE